MSSKFRHTPRLRHTQTQMFPTSRKQQSSFGRIRVAQYSSVAGASGQLEQEEEKRKRRTSSVHARCCVVVAGSINMVGQGPQHRLDELNADAFDENTTDHRAARYAVPQASRADIFPENSLPMFLSDYGGKPNPSEFISPLRRQRRVSLSSLILAGTCGAAAGGVLYALVSSDGARDALAKIDASVAAVLPASVAAQLEPSQLTASKRRTDPAPPPTSENQLPGVPTVKMAAWSPSHDEIKAAYQGALQGNAPPPAAPSVAEPDATPQLEAIRRVDPDEVAASLTRANTLIASGDVAAARLVLRHSADSGDAQAAMLLAETYDPAFLEKLGVRGFVPNVAMARDWYEKARKFGAAEAARRLEVLASR
jgi:hypothetical protein